jgi:uncharacterized protein
VARRTKINLINNMPSTGTSHNRTNKLAAEKSPYLLQHKHNPVDWHPWGPEAFALARAESKPIFLSIGYSTCHWCHVMERESFESKEVADFLNAHYVSIKVDREERPDVDKIYMTFVQAMTSQGGWPLSVFLAPDLKPFYGGTYFPPDSRYGRPSFLQVLKQISELWQSRRDDLLNSSRQLHEQLASATEQRQPTDELLNLDMLKSAATKFKEEYDPRHGGFGGAPKFPRPSQPAFLLRYGVRFQDQEAVDSVLHTCERMAAGGMYDQLGGGFHRYSVDAEWLVPHFEKMLYDNAQLVCLYLDAFQVSGQPRFAEVARDIINYVVRDMTHPDGGFYSAEDADSEGKEGKFYCWTKAELSRLLTPEEFNVAVRHFGVTERGNFVDHSDPDPLPNQNVLSIVQPVSNQADLSLLKSARAKMSEMRAQRVRPHLDDKVLSSWNGMMLGAMSRAYAVLGDERYAAAAEKNLSFIQRHLWEPATKTLYHRWRDGERDSVQLLEAYANMLSGVLDLYEASLEPKQLEFAIDLAETMLERFYDQEEGGFWQSAASAPDLILRIKEDYDGAEPSGNSLAVISLQKLAHITGRKEFRDASERTLRLFADRLQKLPQAVPLLLLGLDFWLEEPKRVVIAFDRPHQDVSSLLRAVHSVYQPGKIVLGTAGPVEEFARGLSPQNGEPVVYLCTGTACQPPTRDGEAIQRMLAR